MSESTRPNRSDKTVGPPRIAGPSALVMFGVTGDLAAKKLMPAIYDLGNRGLLPHGFSLVGFGRRDWSDDHFADNVMLPAIKASARTGFREESWQQLRSGIRFVTGELDDPTAFDKLAQTLKEVDTERGTGGNHAFYLSVPPGYFSTVVDELRDHGLTSQSSDAWSRVIIEKPFGHDLESARELDATVSRAFPPEAVYRIDHYLGKETVQNLMSLRFANPIFGPVWNRDYIDNVQITMAESIGIGSRAGYYDGIGAARDVIQNHLLQLLALTAMEEPTSLQAEQLRIEKQKVLAAAHVPDDLGEHTARGRYAATTIDGEQIPGYVEENRIPADSTTETYAAIRVDIDNRRWAGVPFYLRSAKRMPRRVTEIALTFKPAAHLPFADADTAALGPNQLIIRVQPDEGATLKIGAKVPSRQEIRDVAMDFSYSGSFDEESPEAYERLILDALIGDPALFPQRDEVELSWKILDPVLNYWQSLGTPPEDYPAGTWGPASADAMLARDGFAWRRP